MSDKNIAILGAVGFSIGRTIPEILKEEKQRQQMLYSMPIRTEISYYPPAKTFNKRFPRK